MNLKQIGLLLIALLLVTVVKADEYYWVGDANGNGTWDQVTNWRVDGLPASSVPSSSDNVFFDKTNLHTVTLSADVACLNITVTGNTRFNANAARYIFIYGSANFNTTTTSGNRGGVRFRFTSSSTATFTSNGMPNWHHMIVDKNGGKLTVTDSINFEYLDFYSGELEFAPGTKGYFDRFRSSVTINTVNGNSSGILTADANRTLTLNNAYIRAKREWKYNGTNAVLNAGTSTVEIYCTTNGNFEVTSATQLVYNRFLVTSTYKDFSHNNLTLFLNSKYFRFNAIDAKNVHNHPIVRIYGVPGDSARIGKLESNRRIDLNAAVVDSAVFNTINSTMVVTKSRIKNAYLEGNAHFQAQIQVDTVALSYGQFYHFVGSQEYKMFENFRLLGTPCQGPLILEGGDNRPAYMPKLIKTSGTVNIPYGHIINMNTGGGATFNCTGINENSINWNFTDYIAPGKDFYWIGGGGYRHWNDPMAWSFTSGGAPANCVPSMHDNVFFDNNSNISSETTNNYLNKRIRLRTYVRAYAKDLKFIGDAEHLPYIHFGGRGIDIYGSLLFNQGMGFPELNNSDTLRFLSSATGNTITTNGVPMPRTVFRNPTGEWTLQDSITLPWANHNLHFHEGTLNTNNQSMVFYKFVSQGNLSRALILGSSNIYPLHAGDWGWTYNGTNMTLNAGSSIIHATNTHISSDSTLKYNKIINIGNTHDVHLYAVSAKYVEQVANPLVPWRRVYFQNIGAIDSLVVHRAAEFYNGRMTIRNAQLLGNTFFRTSNTFDTITFGDGTTNYFEQNSKQLVRSKATSISTGCNGYSVFTAMRGSNPDNIPTVTAKIEIPVTETFHINGANVRWMEGVGTGTYSVAGEDLGNNINWTFTPPTTKNLYWVGGSGDWSDKNHWSSTSGGPGGFCLPTEYDNVIFDVNSNLIPTDSLVVFVASANNAKCRNMTWTGTQGVYKSLHVESNLYAYGSIELEQDVDYIVRYFRLYAYTNFTPQTIKTNGAVIKGMLLFGEVNKENLGYWKLLDKLTVNNSTIKINGSNVSLSGQIRVYGTFDSDGNDVEARVYTGFDRSTTYWRNSEITVNFLNVGGASDNNDVCGFYPTANVHADSAHFIIYTNINQNTRIYLQNKIANKIFNKVTVLNATSYNEVNIYGNFTTNYLDIQSGPYTYIRNNVIAKRIDAHNGLRIVEHATVDTLNLGRGEYYLWYNKNYNFKIVQDSPTSCSQQRSLLNGNGSTININIAETLNLTNTEFRNINAIGTGAPYNVTGADLGGNTGLTIGAPTMHTLYLVSDSTIVYWDDPKSWSFTSGGAPSGCIPGRWTNVYVDDNSYIKNPSATLQLRTGINSINSKSHSFTSTRSNRFQMYSELNYTQRALWVYGSIDFNDKSEMIMEHDQSALFLKAETPQTLKLSYIRGRTYFDGTGSWTLLSDFIVDPTYSKVIYLRSGNIKLNGYNMQAAYIHEDASTTNYTIDVNNSTLTSTQLLIPKSVILNTDGSKLVFINRHTGSYYRANNSYCQFDTVLFDMQFNNINNAYTAHATVETQLKAKSVILKSSTNNSNYLVKLMVVDTVNIDDFKTARLNTNSIVNQIVFDKSSTFGAFYSEANKVDMNGSNTIDSMVIAQNGPVYTLKAGTTQTIKNTAFISGSPCKITTFQSATAGQLANLTVPRPMTVDFIQFGHINALSYDGTPGTVLTAERNSTEMTGTFNQNINFVVAPKTVVGLGDDLTACFKSFPYTISSDGFFAGPSATYQWRKLGSSTIISTDKDLKINAPGTYWVKVNYDPIYTCVQDDTVSIARGLPISPVTSYDTIRPICHKDSVVLTISTPIGPNYKYAIKDTTDHTALTLQSSTVFNDLRAGTYYLVVDSLGCFSDSILLTIRPPYRSGVPNDIIINDTVVCPGASVVLSPRTSIGANPTFRWYSDAALTTEITTGVDADGKFTTPILIAPITYYVSVSNDTVCENLTTKGKPVTINITNVNCLNANDDIIYVFACDSVVSDITNNDDYHSGYTININLSGGVPTKGNIELVGNQIKYINTSCTGGETDEYTYAVCSPYLCDTATVKVNILKIPEIVLLDNCSSSPYMSLDVQYPYAQQWQYSPDNSVGSWVDIAQCPSPTCSDITPGFYRVKVQHSGVETYTKVKELTVLRKVLMPGNMMWYQLLLTSH